MIVVLLPDSGRGYLTKVFNDEWMARYGFATDSAADDRRRGGAGRQGKPAARHGARPPDETVAEAIEIMREFGVSQMPVVLAEPPVVTAEVAGSIAERTLLDALFTGAAHLHDRVGPHVPALPTIG